MKEKIYLPKLKSVRIANYSLYKHDIEFDFINGINLIIGGNGVGKTTFVNIIKYALIGLYKKDLTVRNYQGEKRLSRETYKNSNSYFRNRTNNKETDINAFVELTFEINNIEFFVKRGLYDIILLEAKIKKNDSFVSIGGVTIKQDEYAKLENKDENTKKDYLQFKYELAVTQASNMSDFNDFIFFVNQILMFGEDRLNVLWDEKVQSRLLSNYLNDSHLEKQRKDYSYEAKYQDSIARHKQEEIKAIRKIVDKLNMNQKEDSNQERIIEIIKECERLEVSINSSQEKLNSINKTVKNFYKKISDLSILVDNKEKEIYKLESTLLSEYWPGINSKYLIYKKQYLENHICPMCNSSVELESYNSTYDKCFFCGKQIDRIETPELHLLRKELSDLNEERHNLEIQVTNYEKESKKLDSDIRNTRIKLFDLKNEQRDLEILNMNSPERETSYNAMITQIQELSAEKERAQIFCDEYKIKSNDIIRKIQENLVDITKSISSIFSDFAEAFLKVPCYLSLDSMSDSNIKLFVPVVDNKPRYDAEELSESQRFFIDYSFRMSILAYFYNAPSFYICETPDSSLDLSYEENAANTLLKYLDKPNSLILTSNLNNSTFIKSILNRTKEIRVLNLLKYGKISKVQINHTALQKLSNEIEGIVNEQL